MPGVFTLINFKYYDVRTKPINGKAGYYAVIPATVRYDKNLSAMAKLFYGEITCLLQFNNKCFASNAYFSRLYELSEVQVSRIINQLVKAGHIQSETELTKTGSRRLLKTPILNFDNQSLIKNDDKGVINNVKHNNHRVNKQLVSNDTKGTELFPEEKEATKKFKVPTIEEVKEYFIQQGKTDQHERFFDFYESKGWHVGKNKMKDWKAAVRNWVRSQKDKEPPSSPTKGTSTVWA